ncbi:MAG: oxidoreductase [Bacteroidetes bacterium HGW-Bacteroidetes-4]|jgi:ferredoxin--NADP+ reductase|nr:MAG: oxidoreductase [Bacteroidetes bacterium HGW-Bacteroidetes-4]
MSYLQKVKIVSNQQLTQQAYLLSFIKTEPFFPGQIIGVTIDPDIPFRLYSLCSSPDDALMTILFTRKDNGLLTPRLADAKPGDMLWVGEVQGKFLFQNEPAWWIATGTGIAPFYSMFLSGKKPLKLIQGGRKEDEIYFRTDLESLIDYVKCCSQDAGEGIYAGRLSTYLESLDELPKTINYYLCGNAEMVVDVRNLLIQKGVGFANIITEIYF